MATSFADDSDEQLRWKKGHDMTWSCDTSGEPIKFLCDEHNVPLCHPCATKEHQKPCSLKHIGNVILERRKHLKLKTKELEEAIPGFEKVDGLIKSCKAFLAKQLQSVNGEADLVYKNKMKSIVEAERDEIHAIHEEEMRLIIEKRDEGIKARQEKTEEQRKIIENTKKKLTSECEEIEKVMMKQICALENKNKLAIDKLKSINQKMKEIRKTDKELVNGAPHAISSVDETLSANIVQDSVKCLQRMQSDIESVAFAECTRYGQKHYGRILEDIGKWEKVKEIALHRPHVSPSVVGLISDEEVYVSIYPYTNPIGYIINIANGHSKMIIEGNIYSCATLDNKLIVCGKDDGHVTLYDRTHTPWKVVWDIGLPLHCGYMHNDKIYVDVDSDGMILAGVRGQSDIHVINPTNGKILQTITIQGKEMRWGIRSLPSGNIMVGTRNGVFIISRSRDIVSKVLQRSVLYDQQRLVTSSGDKVDIDRDRDMVVVYRRNLDIE